MSKVNTDDCWKYALALILVIVIVPPVIKDLLNSLSIDVSDIFLNILVVVMSAIVSYVIKKLLYVKYKNIYSDIVSVVATIAIFILLALLFKDSIENPGLKVILCVLGILLNYCGGLLLVIRKLFSGD